MRILWDNEIDKYTPLYSSQKSNFPAENVKKIHLSSPWRTADVNGQYYTIDAGVGETITAKCAAIVGKTPDYNHNLTSGVTAKIQAHPTNDWTNPNLNETFAWNADNMVKFFTETAKRFWRFYLDDGANPDGYLNIPRLFLGDYLQMPPIEPGVELPRKTTSTMSISPSGQGYGDEGYRFLAPGFSFPHISKTQYDEINEMWDAVENIKPVILIIWEDSLDIQGPIYCKIDQEELGWKKNDEQGLSWSLEIFFRETF